MNRKKLFIERLKRWYILLPCMTLLVIEFFYLIMRYLHQGSIHPSSNPSDNTLYNFAFFLHVGAIFLFGLWICWVMPICEAKDHTLPFTSSPRKFLQGALFSQWMVPLLPTIIAVLIIAGTTTSYFTDRSFEGVWIVAAGMSIALALICAIPSLRLSRVMPRLIHAKARALNICFDCGYDLRGTEGPTCPECGWVIDKIETTRSATT